jgi:hypothetical protein
MKVNELRIGNWVKSKSGEIVQVNQLEGVGKLELDGIPISSNWLFQLGFKKERVNNIDGYIIGDRLCIFLEEVLCDDGSTEWYSYVQFNVGMEFNELITPPDYIHELQNLYFSLTTRELVRTPSEVFKRIEYLEHKIKNLEFGLGWLNDGFLVKACEFLNRGTPDYTIVVNHLFEIFNRQLSEYKTEYDKLICLPLTTNTIAERMNEYLKTKTGDELIKEFELMGYKFNNIGDQSTAE